MEYRNPCDLKPHPVSVGLYGDNHVEDIQESIAKYGILTPLVITSGNIIISGHRRWRAALNLKLETVPVEVKAYGDELDEKRSILEYNRQREKTFSQKMNEAKLIKDIVAEEAQIRVRANQFGNHGETPRSPAVNGKTADIVGKQVDIGGGDTFRRAEKVWQEANNGNPIAQNLVKQLDAGEIAIKPAYREIIKAEQQKQTADARQELAKVGASVNSNERWCIYQGDIQTWSAPRQYDFIITDPPYPKEYLPLWQTLSLRASEWLKPGGLLIAMSGQSYLDEIYKALCNNLEYYWTACYLTPGQPTPLRQVNVNTTWKPLLIFRKGDYKGKIFGDVFKSDGNDKDYHKWGQSISGMYDIISKMCLPGQYILDPFCGAGTTGIAALKHGCLFDGLELEEENVKISCGRMVSNDAPTGI